jgi:hypothetical protein
MKTFVISNAYVSAAHELIPGGAHTYAKGDDLMPAYQQAMESSVDNVLRGRPVRPAIHARG